MSAFGIEVDESCICLFGPGAEKRDALDTLIEAVCRYGGIADRELFQLALYQREAVMSTGIGDGVAIPHVRFEGVRRPTVAVGLSKEGIDYGAQDDDPVHVFVLFAMPMGLDKEYLGWLAQVMLSLKTPGFREALMACETPSEVRQVLGDYQR